MGAAGLTMIIAALVLLLARQLGASPFVAGMLLLPGSPLVTGWLSARPQLADYAAVPLLTILLRQIAAGRNPGWLVLAAGIVPVVWVYLHAGELFGIAMIFACAVLLLVRHDLREGGWCPGRGCSGPGGSRRIVLYLGLAAGTAVALPSLGHIGCPDPADYPAKVVADIPPHCRLFNTDTLGGFVILERPDVPVFLDTRIDLYGGQRVFAEEQVLSGEDDVTSGLAGAGCVLVPPASGLAKWLRASQEWELRDADPATDLFVRAGH